MAEASTKLTWTGLLRGIGRWLKENLPRALVMSAISFAFAWVVNFWVMAFRWDGFRAPFGSSDYIGAENSLIGATIFWAALSSLLFATVSYGYRAGWGQLRREVFSLPSRIREMFQGEERNRTLTSLAWALALSLLLGLVVSPGVAAVVAGFFVVFAATPFGALLAGVIRRLWMEVVARFAPHKGEPSSQVGSAAVTAAGMVLGFVIVAAIDLFALRLLAMVFAALAAYYFANEDQFGSSGGTAVLVLMAAAVGLYELFEVSIAFADDGGWSECGDCNIIDYITSTGATEVVSRSTVTGGGAAVAAPVGAAIGDVLGTIGGGPGGGTPPSTDSGPSAPAGDPAAPAPGQSGPADPGVRTASEDVAPAPAPGGSDALDAIGGGADGQAADWQPSDAGDAAPPPTEPAAPGTAGGPQGAGAATRRAPSEPAPATPPPPDAAPPPSGDVTTAGDVEPAPDAAPAPDDGDPLGAIGGGEGGTAADWQPNDAGDAAPPPPDGAPGHAGGPPPPTRRTGPPPDAPPPPPDQPPRGG